MTISEKFLTTVLTFCGIAMTGAAMAQVPAFYYQGDRKVLVEVRTDALSVESSAPLSDAQRVRIESAVPGANVGPSSGHAQSMPGQTGIAPGQTGASPDRVFLKTEAAGLADLNARAQEVRNAAPGVKVRPVLLPQGAESDAESHVLTEEISFKVKANAPPAAVDALAKKYAMSDVKPVAGIPGAYTAVINGNTSDLLAPLTAANRMQESGDVDWAAPLVEKKQLPRAVPNDPFFPNQWHLQNNGTNTTEGLVGNDLNVIPAWAHSTGAGVNIAISDDGVDTSHTDLLANLRTDLDWDFNSNDDNPFPLPAEGHGTACAGVSAGKGNNGIGISGVAPDAGIIGLRLISAPVTDAVEANAMLWKYNVAAPLNQVAINSNSWGPSDSGKVVAGPGPLMDAALETGALQGRNGKGIVYSWAAGNGRGGNDNINRDGYATSPYVIAVGATNSTGTFSWYSEPGSAMLINAPSNHIADGIFTTDISGTLGQNPTDYRNNFGGTSSAAPAVSGAIALLLEANPNLTYRDVMHILADTAVKNDPASLSWAANGSGRLFSHNYGFGRVNAGAAVVAALGWQNVPAAAAPIVVSDILTTSVAIPDNNTTGVTFDVPVAHGSDFFIEHVELQADITHLWRGDVRVRLISPSGMVSELMVPNVQDSGDHFSNWKFRSVAHWGEQPNGTWKVQLSDIAAPDAGTVNSLTLRIRGYEVPAAGVSEWGVY